MAKCTGKAGAIKAKQHQKRLRTIAERVEPVGLFTNGLSVRKSVVRPQQAWAPIDVPSGRTRPKSLTGPIVTAQPDIAAVSRAAYIALL